MSKGIEDLLNGKCVEIIIIEKSKYEELNIKQKEYDSLNFDEPYYSKKSKYRRKQKYSYEKR